MSDSNLHPSITIHEGKQAIIQCVEYWRLPIETQKKIDETEKDLNESILQDLFLQDGKNVIVVERSLRGLFVSQNLQAIETGAIKLIFWNSPEREHTASTAPAATNNHPKISMESQNFNDF